MNVFFRYGIPAAIVLAGLLMAGLMIMYKRPAERSEVEVRAPAVRVVRVEAAPHQFVVRSQGTVAAKRTIHLLSQVQGQVIAISPNFEVGGFFTAGEELVSLDPRDYELALTEAEARVAAARLQLETMRAQAEVAEEEWRDIGNRRAASALVLREPQLAEAESGLEAAKAAVAQAELDLERTHIRAPFTGRVREKNVDVGQYVRAGEELAELFSIDTAEILLPLPLEDLAYLDLPRGWERGSRDRPGPEVIFRARYAGREASWRGRLVRMTGEIDPVSRMAKVIGEVEDPFGIEASTDCPPLKAGLFVEAEILGRTQSEAVVIPRDALRMEDRVLVVDANEHLEIRDVEVLRATREHAVIGEGLSTGDRLCVTSLSAPVEGMRVRVMNPEGDQP